MTRTRFDEDSALLHLQRFCRRRNDYLASLPPGARRQKRWLPDTAMTRKHSEVESRINSAGYAALFADDPDRARQILKLNTDLFPDSANTWDSLAEVVLFMGDPRRALALYRRALEIDPEFSSAAEGIEKIRRQRRP